MCLLSARPRVFGLALLSLALMGSTCSFRASSGGHDSGKQKSGVVVVVDTDGDPQPPGSGPADPTGGGLGAAEVTIVQQALAISALAGDEAPSTRVSAGGDPARRPPSPPPAFTWESAALAPAAAATPSGREGAAPEPDAALLFALGATLWVASRRLGSPPA